MCWPCDSPKPNRSRAPLQQAGGQTYGQIPGYRRERVRIRAPNRPWILSQQQAQRILLLLGLLFEQRNLRRRCVFELFGLTQIG